MLARILLSLVLGSLLGCGSTARAPVEDRNAQSRFGAYTVQRGDTLYSIAFRSGLDYRKVAAANGIAAPYTIYPGQNIVLNEVPPQGVSGVTPTMPASRSTSSAVPVATPVPIPAAAPVRAHGSSTAYPSSSGPVTAGSAVTGSGIAIANAPDVSPPVPVTGSPAAPYSTSAPTSAPTSPPTPVSTPVPGSVLPSASTTGTSAPITTTPATTPSTATTNQVAAPTAAPPVAAVQTPPEPYTGGKVDTWLWPTAGAVTRGYSESVHKGIDIGGERGDPIVAVAAGKVVYGGTGIVGFGELLIVKHNEEFLSAYGHNDRLLVTEGQTVSAGQVIAEKGSSGTDTVKLHFEIRKEGKPIDPQRVLPRR